ncbi:MAG: aspartate kinase [bacterium]
MALIVQKFGGASLATPEKMLYVVDRIIKTKKKGNSMIVVVSAPGDTTDDLIEFAHKVAEYPNDRELDMLMATGEQQSIALISMALISKGVKAKSFTGAQLGIMTDKTHTKARIMGIKGIAKVRKALKEGCVVVAAGFQGITEEDDITTLGRGGSDLTAVALAHAAKADVVEFLKDVEGVYTANPKIVPDAKKIDALSYDEMLELAAAGAEVLNNRSVEYAKNYNIVLHVRGTFSEKNGTIIKQEDKSMEKIVVSGITYNKKEAKATIMNVPDKPGIAAVIFSKIAEKGINVDVIIQNISQKGTTDISFTIPSGDVKKLSGLLDVIVKNIKASGYTVDEKIGKVSVVGIGMKSHPGVAAKMFKALADKKINIEMISTSEIKIAVVLRETDIEEAVKALHTAFKLGKK